MPVGFVILKSSVVAAREVDRPGCPAAIAAGGVKGVGGASKERTTLNCSMRMVYGVVAVVAERDLRMKLKEGSRVLVLVTGLKIRYVLVGNGVVGRYEVIEFAQ